VSGLRRITGISPHGFVRPKPLEHPCELLKIIELGKTEPSIPSRMLWATPACMEVMIGRPQAMASAIGKPKEFSPVGET